jgi:hypothetical protein
METTCITINQIIQLSFPAVRHAPILPAGSGLILLSS